jgi:hypothetical protein
VRDTERRQPEQLSGPGKISTVEVFVQNNVSAHKKDFKGAYTTAIALIPNLIAGTTATLTNNVGCDNVNDYMDVDSCTSSSGRHRGEVGKSAASVVRRHRRPDHEAAALTRAIAGKRSP